MHGDDTGEKKQVSGGSGVSPARPILNLEKLDVGQGQLFRVGKRQTDNENKV